MKKLLSIFCVFLFLYISLGYIFIISGLRFDLQRNVRQQINKGLPSSLVSLIKIPITEEKGDRLFKWLGDDEFIYRGNLFDLVKKEIRNDTIYYYCFNDKQEEQISSNLDDFMKNILQDSKSTQQKAKKIPDKFTDDYIIQNKAATNLSSNISGYSDIKLSLYVSIHPEVLSPPPKSIA